MAPQTSRQNSQNSGVEVCPSPGVVELRMLVIEESDGKEIGGVKK